MEKERPRRLAHRLYDVTRRNEVLTLIDLYSEGGRGRVARRDMQHTTQYVRCHHP